MEDRMAPFVKAGRAAFGVVLKGYIGRPRPAGGPSRRTVEYRRADRRASPNFAAAWTISRRGPTRSDADCALAPSAGATLGLIVGASKPGIARRVHGRRTRPPTVTIMAAANPTNFAPHIRAPKLIVQGRYDEDTPARTAAEAAVQAADRAQTDALYDGGHVPSIEVMMSATSGWLDETLGRVTR